MTQHAPVLIVGGSGVVGSRAAHLLRRYHPGLPIAIGARDKSRAAAVAADVGGPTYGLAVDVSCRDLGQSDGDVFSAVLVFLRDETLNTMRFAQERGIPYVSLSSGTFEVGPEVARYIHDPDSAPVLLASHWLAGAAVFPALHVAREYATVDEIRIGVLVDPEDFGGPAAHADYERIMRASPAALRLTNGTFEWVDGDAGRARFRRVDGVDVPAQAYGPFDVIGLAAATDARGVWLDLAIETSSSRARGAPFSTEIIIEISGAHRSRGHARTRVEVVHPEGQAPLTALCAILGVERLLGLDGQSPVPAGLYLPESLLDPAYVVGRMREIGAEVRHAPEVLA